MNGPPRRGRFVPIRASDGANQSNLATVSALQFIAYSAAKVMPAPATRAARGNLGLDDY